MSDEIDSPIRILLPYLREALFHVAPERAAELPSTVASLTIAFEEGPGFPFASCVEERLISVSCRGLEYLWVLSFAAWTVTNRYIREGMIGGKLDFGDDPSTEHLPRLLGWAVANQLPLQKAYLPWPEGTPTPEGRYFVEVASMSDQAVAGEIALIAAAWIMHHELAHIINDHRPGDPASVRNEEIADLQALEWLLAKAPDANILFRRGLGIVVALIGIAGLEMATSGSRHGPRTHPHPADRIFRALDHPYLYQDDRFHLVAALQLAIHLGEYGVGITDPGNQPARDALGSVCRALREYFP